MIVTVDWNETVLIRHPHGQTRVTVKRLADCLGGAATIIMENAVHEHEWPLNSLFRGGEGQHFFTPIEIPGTGKFIDMREYEETG